MDKYIDTEKVTIAGNHISYHDSMTGNQFIIQITTHKKYPDGNIWHLEYISVGNTRKGDGSQLLEDIIRLAQETCDESKKHIYLFMEPDYGAGPFYNKFFERRNLSTSLVFDLFNHDTIGIMYNIIPSVEL